MTLRIVAALLLVAATAHAGVGDPQVRTDHRWYPGELACSTFDALFATQAALYEQVVGKKPVSDEDKALAAWLWRNTHYCHAEEGVEDLWGKGFTKGDVRSREYWTGMFSHGFALCGTTHAQWCAEMEALFGHGRARCVGTAGHNSFEVFLTGGSYGKGKWALLDHDLSTVIFDRKGGGLMSIKEVAADWKRLTSRTFSPEKQRGWLPCGLHPGDGSSLSRFSSAEYFAGYAGPPPAVHLRRGETMRRYHRPGLADGKTFVFWGRNYNAGGVPGPERSHAWVNQPEKMYRSKSGAGYKVGQARYGNAVFTYRPDFASGDYREGVVSEGEKHVDLEHSSPYIIAATPANEKVWGIYDAGCRNGLVLRGKADCKVSLSLDRGKTWQDCGAVKDGLDLTDRAKGHRQYRLRLHATAKEFVKSGLTITTVCQANPATMPRLADGGSKVTFRAGGRAVVSAGPTVPQAEAHLVDGKFGTANVTLELATPRGEEVIEVHAAAHVGSGNPPSPAVKYQIELSTDGGKTWSPVAKDWTIPRRGEEPKDFWSQSMCWGVAKVAGKPKSVRVRFRNSGGKAYLRCEAHLVYRPARADATEVKFAWKDDGGDREASHTFPGGEGEWPVKTGKGVEMRWVELAARKE
jgi:hypothetical protein